MIINPVAWPADVRNNAHSSTSRKMTPPLSQKVVTLIVTYNPSGGIKYLLEKLFSEYDRAILVDNGSPTETQDMLLDQARRRNGVLILLLNPKNLGIATALNQGFDWAILHGYHFVIAVDQDSLPIPGMARTLMQVFNNHQNRDKIAIIAPVIQNPIAGIIASYLRPKYNLFFERARCTGEVLENVSIVITSGSMYNLRVFDQLGPFRDDFFIDYVDTENCLRAKQHGFNIIVACNALLHHKLGNQKKVRLGSLEMRPTFHSVTRWYYISRNRIFMIWNYSLSFPHWSFYELITCSYGFLRMLLFEDCKVGKILAILIGSIDGLIGQKGIIQDSRKRILSKFG